MEVGGEKDYTTIRALRGVPSESEKSEGRGGTKREVQIEVEQ